MLLVRPFREFSPLTMWVQVGVIVAFQPSIGPDGILYVIWLRCHRSQQAGVCQKTGVPILLSKSSDRGNSWNQPYMTLKSIPSHSPGKPRNLRPLQKKHSHIIGRIPIRSGKGRHCGKRLRREFPTSPRTTTSSSRRSGNTSWDIFAKLSLWLFKFKCLHTDYSKLITPNL